jgi:hypothetical protein
MSSKQFFALIGTGIFCALLFAAPGLHRLYTEINKRDGNWSIPMWGTARLGNIDLEIGFSIFVTRETQPKESRGYNDLARKTYFVAELTNPIDKDIEIRDLILKVVMSDNKVEFIRQPFISNQSERVILKPKASTKIQVSGYQPIDIVGWLDGKCEVLIEGDAVVVELPKS